MSEWKVNVYYCSCPLQENKDMIEKCYRSEIFRQKYHIIKI